MHGTRPQPVPGIAASFAAGLVSCDGAARMRDVAVERGLFTAAAEAAGITAGRLSYPARLAAGPAFDQLSLELLVLLPAPDRSGQPVARNCFGPHPACPYHCSDLPYSTKR